MANQTIPPAQSDPFSDELQEDALNVSADEAKRIGQSFFLKAQSDANYQAPVKFHDAQGKAFYLGVPAPLKRQFSSPVLTSTGPFNTGPNKERLVTSGWNDARSNAFGAAANKARKHHGVDFASKLGENVYAAGSGTVTFVGIQTKGVRKQLVQPHVPDPTGTGTVVDANGVTYAASLLGFGGVYISILHNDDFHGYSTQYMHLSNTAVTLNQQIAEGALIGNTGVSGGNNGHFPAADCHLHWQVHFGDVDGPAVNPMPLVPMYYPGHSPATAQNVVPSVIPDAVYRTVGEQLMHANVLGAAQTYWRAITMQNLTAVNRDTLREQQAATSTLAGKHYNMHATALYEAVAKFQAGVPTIANGMAFDFTKGTWTDDGNPT